MRLCISKLIRSDGTETILCADLTLADIRRILRCAALDTVTLDWARQVVMFVDDTGVLEGKPLNTRATELYHAVCKPGTTAAIHGNVVIAQESDIETESGMI